MKLIPTQILLSPYEDDLNFTFAGNVISLILVDNMFMKINPFIMNITPYNTKLVSYGQFTVFMIISYRF